MSNVAVIGAGLAGSIVADALRNKAQVTLFDKARGVGGRMATRRAESYQFDHGAPFFTVQSQEFKQFVERLLNAGVIAHWNARFAEFMGDEMMRCIQWGEEYPHYVGVPSMNSVVKHLCQGLSVRLGNRIDCLKKDGDQWLLLGEDHQCLGAFDWVVLAVPAAQCNDLLPQEFVFKGDIQTKTMQGCFSLMLGFEEELDLGFDAALIRDKDISWLSVNNSKPRRSNSTSVLVHSTNAWADDYIEDDSVAVKTHLIKEVQELIGEKLTAIEHSTLHRWRYANIGKQVGDPFCVDKNNKLAVCGDWFVEGKVEGAFKSGFGLANHLINSF